MTIGLVLALLVGALLWALPGAAAGTPWPSRAEHAAAKTGVVSAEAGKAKMPRYAPDRVLVRFKEGVSTKQALKLHGAVGAQVLRSYRIVPGLQLVRLPRGMNVAQALAAYRRDPRVLYAEPDYALHLEGYLAPGEPPVNDPMYGEQWSLHDGVYGGIDAPAAWVSIGQTNTPREVVVAVLDTGVDVTHEDLAGRLWVNGAEANGTTGVDDDGNGVADDVYGVAFLDGHKTGDVTDGNGHGTHVAGIIAAATDNGLGIAGVVGKAPVRIVACKFMNEKGEGWTSDAVDALEYVLDMKARGAPVAVVNASWGGYGYSKALRDTIARLQQANILFVAAAGNRDTSDETAANDWRDNDLWREYPASYDLPNVVSVAASTYGGGLASWSNYGLRTVDLAAPGDGIVSTVPSLVASGVYYHYMYGTSMAAAHASGVAALLAALWPEREPQWWELRNALLSGAGPREELRGYTVTGGLLSASGAVYAALHEGPELLAVLAPGPEVRTLLYAPVPLAALHVKGAGPAEQVTVEIEDVINPENVLLPLSLTDDGKEFHDAPGDGLYRGTAMPDKPGDYRLTFKEDPSASDGPTVTAHVYDAQPYVPLPTDVGYTGWRDLSQATPLNLADDSWAEVTVPFAVYCFGQRYDAGDKLYVCDNGLISFGAPPPQGPGEAGFWLPDPLPTPRLPYPAVAALWQDFDPLRGSVVYGVHAGPSGNELVIEWRNLYRYGAEGPYTFQVVLGENRNDILVQYRQDEQTPGTFTGTVGIQFSPDAATPYPGPETAQPVPAPGLAVRFMVPGDLNQNARQDDADLAEWASRYGTRAVALWDPADLCPDGEIDLLDFAVTGRFWHCTSLPFSEE